MSKEQFVGGFCVVVLIVVIIALVAAGTTQLGRRFQNQRQERCASLGERLGYETELISGYCYIEVRPGLKVRVDQVLDFLPVIDCR